MFQSHSGQSTSTLFSPYHAAARSLSGGLLSITDVPTQHNTALFEHLTCRSFPAYLFPKPSTTPHSRAQIPLRVNPAKSTHVYSSDTEHRLSKISTSTIETGVRILGVFNPFASGTGNREISEIITLEDFFPSHSNSNEWNEEGEDDKENDALYIIRTFTHDSAPQYTSPISLTSCGSSAGRLLVKVPVGGYVILTAHRVHSIIPNPQPGQTHQTSPRSSNPSIHTAALSSRHLRTDSEVRIAVLGLLDKFIGSAAITSTCISPSYSPAKPQTISGSESRSNANMATISLRMKGTGILGLYISSSSSPSASSSQHVNSNTGHFSEERSHNPAQLPSISKLQIDGYDFSTHISHHLDQNANWNWRLEYVAQAGGYILSIDLTKILDSQPQVQNLGSDVKKFGEEAKEKSIEADEDRDDVLVELTIVV